MHSNGKAAEENEREIEMIHTIRGKCCKGFVCLLCRGHSTIPAPSQISDRRYSVAGIEGTEMQAAPSKFMDS